MNEVSIRILYVDDEPDLLELCKVFLEMNGEFKVDTLTSVKEALIRLKSIYYDAIISDYQMPEMDGITFLKILRESGNDIPFIVFTGRGREEVVIEAFNSGADFYLQKGGQPNAQFAELSNQIRIAVERRTSEKSLKESEEYYRIVADFTYDWEYWIAPDGEFNYISPSCERITGYSPEEFYLDPNLLIKITHPDDQIKIKNHLNNALTPHEKNETLPYRIITKTGELKWIEHECQPVYKINGDYWGNRGSNRDITDRKILEETLQAERDQAQQYVDIAGVMLVVLNRNGIVTMINRKGCEILEYTKEEIVGRNWFEMFIPEELRVEVRGIFNKIMNADMATVEYYENPILTKTNKKRIIAFHNAFIQDREGICGILFSGNDISSHIQMEETLKEKEELFKGIFEGANDAIFLHYISPDGTPGKYIKVNNIACQRLGMTQDELLQKTPFDIVSSKHLPKIPKISIDLSLNKSGVFDAIHRRKDGTEFPVEISTRILKLKGNEVAISVARDITERRQMEKAVQNAIQKLNLFSNITRNNIMNKVITIQSFLHYIDKIKNIKEIESFFDKIYDLAKNIETQIKFSQCYQDLGVKPPKWMNLFKLVVLASNSSVHLACEIRNLEIFADPLIANMFLYLVENTIRYGETATDINIYVVTEKDNIRIIFTDNGIGIPFEKKESIFQPIHRNYSDYDLFFIREILSITDITIQETGESGYGVKFEIIVPNGKWRFIEDLL